MSEVPRLKREDRVDMSSESNADRPAPADDVTATLISLYPLGDETSGDEMSSDELSLGANRTLRSAPPLDLAFRLLARMDARVEVASSLLPLLLPAVKDV